MNASAGLDEETSGGKSLDAMAGNGDYTGARAAGVAPVGRCRSGDQKESGNPTLFSANEASPIFAEMRAIVAKTVGVRDILLAALSPLAANIDLAFVYGSVARSRGASKATSI
jgi:hypothetical protein